MGVITMIPTMIGSTNVMADLTIMCLS